MTPSVPVLEMHRVVKNYGALRPLRIAELTVAPGERVSIAGLDAGVGELLVNLVTGAALPDEGTIRVFGRLTSEIATGDEWLDWLDRFGIVSPRGVLLEEATLEQNLAMPYTLQIDPVPREVGSKVRTIAARCGVDPDRWLSAPARALPADVRVRAHLARALALDPQIIIVEHPTADVDAAARAGLAADIVAASGDGNITVLTLSNDEIFGKAVASRALKLDGATGQLKAAGKRWFTW